MIVREFGSEDRQDFLRLCSDFYNANATLRPYNPEVAQNTFQRILDHHENLWGFMLVDMDTATDIGYALITSYWCNEEGGNVLVLDELYIDPKCRGKGFATLFIEWLESYFKDKAVSITLEVLTTNVTASNLYRKEGYQPDGFTTYTKEIK